MGVVMGECKHCGEELKFSEHEAVKLLNDLVINVDCSDCGVENEFMVDITQL